MTGVCQCMSSLLVFVITVWYVLQLSYGYEICQQSTVWQRTNAADFHIISRRQCDVDLQLHRKLQLVVDRVRSCGAFSVDRLLHRNQRALLDCKQWLDDLNPPLHVVWRKVFRWVDDKRSRC